MPGFAAFDSNQFDIGDIVLTIDNVPVLSMPFFTAGDELPWEICAVRKFAVQVSDTLQLSIVGLHSILQVRGVDLANIKKLTIGEAGTNVVLTMRSLIEVCFFPAATPFHSLYLLEPCCHLVGPRMLIG